jgi:hypothetical protein
MKTKRHGKDDLLLNFGTDIMLNNTDGFIGTLLSILPVFFFVDCKSGVGRDYREETPSLHLDLFGRRVLPTFTGVQLYLLKMRIISPRRKKSQQGRFQSEKGAQQLIRMHNVAASVAGMSIDYPPPAVSGNGAANPHDRPEA